jgi:hypothetical protein
MTSFTPKKYQQDPANGGGVLDSIRLSFPRSSVGTQPHHTLYIQTILCAVEFDRFFESNLRLFAASRQNCTS